MSWKDVVLIIGLWWGLIALLIGMIWVPLDRFKK